MMNKYYISKLFTNENIMVSDSGVIVTTKDYILTDIPTHAQDVSWVLKKYKELIQELYSDKIIHYTIGGNPFIVRKFRVVYEND